VDSQGIFNDVVDSVPEGDESNTPLFPPHLQDSFNYGPFSPSRGQGPISGINSLLASAINTNESQGRTLAKALETIEQLSQAFHSLSEDVESMNGRIYRLEKYHIATHTHLAERIDKLEELANKAGSSKQSYIPTARRTQLPVSASDPKGK